MNYELENYLTTLQLPFHSDRSTAEQRNLLLSRSLIYDYFYVLQQRGLRSSNEWATHDSSASNYKY